MTVRQQEVRTPTTGSAPRPSREEMHPSKAHQSTTKQVDSGLVLGFNPIKKDANGNVLKDSMAENTPTKTKVSLTQGHFGTPGYEFKFGQEAQLSDEAKQLMDRVRGEAAHIRAQMVMEKAKQGEQDKEVGHQQQGDRKIAMPKGKAGRFSDVHMAEFKKMDSIANHPSSFRAVHGRFQPVTKSLKRSKSKAQLDETESSKASPSRSPTKPPTATTPSAVNNKRVKHNPASDASSEHSQSKTTQPAQQGSTRKPAGPRPRSTIRSNLMTPTRASMARSTSASLKAPKTSLIPSLARSPDTRARASPRTPRTDFNPRFKSSLPTLGNLKSILRRRQPLFSRDPAKIAAGTHVAAPDFKPDSLFATQGDMTDSAPTPSPKKHVEFTPSVKSRHELAEASPSRSKIPTTPSRSNISDIVYPTLPALTPEQKAAAEPSDKPTPSPTIRHVRKSSANHNEGAYPEIPVVAHGIAHGIVNKKRHREEMDDNSKGVDNTENVPPADSQAQERSAKRIKATPSPVKVQPAKTPTRTPSGRMGTPASAKRSRGVLSLSRLNMLAKPKERA